MEDITIKFIKITPERLNELVKVVSRVIDGVAKSHLQEEVVLHCKKSLTAQEKQDLLGIIEKRGYSVIW